jgi:DNA repair protein RadC
MLAMTCPQHAVQSGLVHQEPTATAAINYPSDACSDAELISRVCESAVSIPATSAGLHSVSGLTEAELRAIFGLTENGSHRLALALALHRRLLAYQRPKQIDCSAPAHVAAAMRPFVGIDHERVWCLPLDTRSRLIGEPIEVSRGDIDGSDANPRLIYRPALRAGAAAVVVVHNHPSGDPAPSVVDYAITRRLSDAGATLGVLLIDHVIVTSDGRWRSMRHISAELFVS